MAATATAKDTIKLALNRSKAGEVEDALRKVGLGDVLSPVKTTVSQAAAPTVTLSPAALVMSSVRVTAGAAAAGLRQIGDAGATPSATVATLSDDGKTLTFEADVTGAIVVYVQRSDTDLSSDFAPSPKVGS